jgi:hypothetical protein
VYECKFVSSLAEHLPLLLMWDEYYEDQNSMMWRLSAVVGMMGLMHGMIDEGEDGQVQEELL